jgi:hypothetical protein
VYLTPLRTVADNPSGKGQIMTHAEIDAIFINIELIVHVNEGFLAELEGELDQRGGEWKSVQYGEIMQRHGKQLKGCYTRYVSNYDTAEAALRTLKEGNKERDRYLEVCKTHPDANGLDLRSFLIQPVQRPPRYRMLLEDLLQHTDEGHGDEAPLREAYAQVCEVCMHINEEKRHLDDVEKMRQLVSRFANAERLERELVSYHRKLLKEGVLSKVRMSKTQQRLVFLCNDVILYGAKNPSPGQRSHITLKGKIWLNDGARVERLPSTDAAPHAFAVIASAGKGYTWLAESDAEADEWYQAIRAAISTDSDDEDDGDDEVLQVVGGRSFAGGGWGRDRGASREASQLLSAVMPKPLALRVQQVKAGGLLTKYNLKDGKASTRWVRLQPDAKRIVWGDAKTRKCNDGLALADASALIHGAKSAAFFKMGSRQGTAKAEAWRCFTIVFPQRTLDLAAESPSSLLDWYLALASLMPHSTEALLDEDGLRARMERMWAS